MTVVVDQVELPAAELGLETVGRLLQHVRERNRLVVDVMIDGRHPDLDSIDELRQQPLSGRTIHLQTADPSRVALECLDEIERLLGDGEPMRADAVEHLQAGQTREGLQKLAICFNAWQASHEGLMKIARLLRLDLHTVRLDDSSLGDWMRHFADQLRSIRTALETRDYVTLSDILAFEAQDSTQQWFGAVGALRSKV